MFSEGDFVATKILNQKFILKITGNAFFETVNNNEFKLSKFRGVFVISQRMRLSKLRGVFVGSQKTSIILSNREWQACNFIKIENSV